nr:immunoglobulin light chain junction region [Macaca mulatta]
DYYCVIWHNDVWVF